MYILKDLETPEYDYFLNIFNLNYTKMGLKLINYIFLVTPITG